MTTLREAEAVAEPVQEPIGYWQGKFSSDGGAVLYEVPQISAFGYTYRNIPVYTSPPQRKPLTEEEIKACEKQAMVNGALPFEQRVFFARAIERAHGIT